MASTTGPILLLAVGGLLVVWAVASLFPGSPLRRLYGLDPSDDRGARVNAAVLGGCGLGVVALAGAIAAGVPGRVLGTVTVLAAALLCVGLGWLVRYRDRRELLTTPTVDRETARRLGGAVIVCGVLLAPLAPAIWFDVGDEVLALLALGGSLVATLAVALAVR
jgi:hypothetical protein